MNRETTDKIIVYARNTESGYNICNAFFVNLRPLLRNVTNMRYLEDCSGNDYSSVVNNC